MNILISVIVPVYNMAAYLPECLDSLCQQLNDPVELIIVDDGSTDGSRAIIQSYGAAFPGIRLITQDNRGLSAARNAGLEKAEGDYIWFVDADDVVEPYALKTLINFLRRYPGTDMLRFGYTRFRDADGTTVNIFQPEAAGPLPVTVYFNAYPLMHEACMGLYRRAYLSRSHLKFAEGHIFEDSIFNMQAYTSGGILLVLPLTLYRYRLREGSLSQSATSRSKIKSVIFLIETCDRILAAERGNLRAVSFVANRKLDYVNLLTDHLFSFSGAPLKWKRRAFLTVNHRIPIFRGDLTGIILMKIFLRLAPKFFFKLRRTGLKWGWFPSIYKKL